MEPGAALLVLCEQAPLDVRAGDAHASGPMLESHMVWMKSH